MYLSTPVQNRDHENLSFVIILRLGRCDGKQSFDRDLWKKKQSTHPFKDNVYAYTRRFRGVYFNRYLYVITI